MATVQEVNFRATSGFVSGDSADAHVETSTGNNYPTTSAQGVSVGWTSGASSIDRRNVSAGIDARLAGIAASNSGTTACTYRIDLTALGGAGTYRIRVAMGDDDNARPNQKLEVFDDTTSKGVLINGAAANHRWLDATGVELTATTWPTSNAYVDIVFATSTANFKFGDGANNWAVSHIRIEKLGGSDVTAALTGTANTSAAGTIGPASSKALTGSANTASAGTLAPATSKALTGSAATGAAGTLVPTSSKALTGSASTFSAGTLTPIITVSVAGGAANFSQGNVNAGNDVIAALTGQGGTASAGTIAPSRTISISGSAATGTSGTLTPASSKAISGSAIASAIGTLIAANSPAISGQSLTAALGTLSAAITRALTGSGLTGALGSLTVQTGSDIILALTGQALVVGQGTVTVPVFESTPRFSNTARINTARLGYASDAVNTKRLGHTVRLVPARRLGAKTN